MPLKPEDRAEYMRNYRAAKAGKPVTEEEIAAALGRTAGLVDENLVLSTHLAAKIESLEAERDALLVKNAALIENIQTLVALNLHNDTIEADVAVERDALRAEVKRLEVELATRPLPGTNPINDIPEPWKTDATRVAGSHASGPWTPEFRPAPKSVAEPKPKRRR